jgi:tetratricopeptide (TPR) repeat protein
MVRGVPFHTMRLFGLVLLLFSLPSLSQEGAHKHAGSGEMSETPAVANRFGTVHFQISCKPEVQADFNNAVALLHSFEYEEARSAFVEVGKKDPQCAMVKWGEAMTYFHGLWSEYNGAEGARAAADARRLAAANPLTTKREQAYIDAISVMFSDDALKITQKPDSTGFSEPPREFEGRYTQKMAELHQQFPEDREATIFYALALNISAKRSDKTHADLRQCTTLLNPLFAEMPNHPGIAHYIIHCNDNPETAEEGLDAARKYAQIAPASAHATHMPSHIFAQLGLWDEMVESNFVSMRTAEGGPNANSCEKVGNALHAMSFLVVALAETGRLTEAREIVRHAMHDRLEVKGGEHCSDESRGLVLAAYVVETGEWARAKEFQPESGTGSPVTGVLWMTTGVGAAMSGDSTLAGRAEQELAQIRDARVKMPGQSSENASEALRLAVTGWKAQKAGQAAEAVAMLRKAADLQDRLGSNLVIFKPLREMLADLLMQQGNAAQALVEYKASLDRQPNRFQSLYGAGSAAFATGDATAGKVYFNHLLAFAKGDERRELVAVRARMTEDTVAVTH